MEPGHTPLPKSFSAALLTAGILSCVGILFLLLLIMRFLCIAYSRDCDVRVYFYLLPAWLKGIVPAVLWSWYALHIMPLDRNHVRNLPMWLVIIALVIVIVFCILVPLPYRMNLFS